MNGISDTSRAVLEQIYDFLKQKEYEVYFPGQHKGEALTQYVVVMDSGTISGIKMIQKTYSIMCYVPLNKYSNTEEMINKIKKDMTELFPLLRPTGTETPAVYDEKVNGYTASIEYMNYRKIPLWIY